MTTPTGMRGPGALGAGRSLLELSDPRSVATYSDYAEAQGAVDHLSDEGFPVDQLAIVGSDLRQVERVTGRLTWGRVLAGGLLSGLWLGAFVGLVMSLFTDDPILAVMATTLGAGAVFGLVWAAIGYAMTQGRRDFTSVTAVVATSYEVLAEAPQVAAAREMLGLGAPAPVHTGPLRTYGEAVDAARAEQAGRARPDDGSHRTATGEQGPLA
ncbi:general stress protein [Kytococcus schroeteri]|nr:general stress protein [Kytococcus schroeteri]